MNLSWNLDKLYSSFDSKEFRRDIELCDTYLVEFKNWIISSTENYEDVQQKLENYIEISVKGYNLFSKLNMFCQLTLSVDTKNANALKYVEALEIKEASMAEKVAKLNKWIGRIENISEIILKSDLLKAYNFHFAEIKEHSKFLLSDLEEAVVAKMQNTGSNAWTKLRELLAASLMVEIEVEGKNTELPLSVIRNMAYDKDETIRKRAYVAELKAYPKIEDSIAACLNGIKGEVITLSKLRGFNSPLEETLFNSRMDFETLDSMFVAIKESLPIFRKFFMRKSELLGSNKGLPFYNLFAPLGSSNMEFSYEKAIQFVEDNFRTFSDNLANYAKKAIESSWIDVMPKEGKVGGAFCENVFAIGESRFLLNYGNAFGDVVTLAHELGHGYHGECMKNESVLNCDYPMPLAETASTFCETIVKKAAVKTATKEESFAILETEISDCAQVIVDIYSRFLFESEVFRRRGDGSCSASELKEIMLWAQRSAYGDALDKDFLHPYMWACKPHYYYAGANFYNFPYAFGLLFAKGLYAEYLKKGTDFIKSYDYILSVTGKNKISEVAMLAGIDVHDVNFWRSSLKTIEEDIEKFIELSN